MAACCACAAARARGYRDIIPEEQMRFVLELETESRKLANVDVIVFAATSPSIGKPNRGGPPRSGSRRLGHLSGGSLVIAAHRPTGGSSSIS